MPVYEVEDTLTGTIFELEGTSPPTEDELLGIFAKFRPAEEPDPEPPKPSLLERGREAFETVTEPIEAAGGALFRGVQALKERAKPTVGPEFEIERRPPPIEPMIAAEVPFLSEKPGPQRPAGPEEARLVPPKKEEPEADTQKREATRMALDILEAMPGGEVLTSALAFGGGFKGMVPFLETLTGGQKVSGEVLKEENPKAATAGAVTSVVAQAFAGAPVAANAVAKIANPLLRGMATRAIVSSGVTGAKGADDVITGRRAFDEVFWDTVQAGGAGAFSALPELIPGLQIGKLVIPWKAIQVIGQPAADIAYDASIDALRGREVGTADWWSKQIPSIVLSELFALKDVKSGKSFELSQEAGREGLKKILGIKDATYELRPTQKFRITGEPTEAGEGEIQRIVGEAKAREAELAKGIPTERPVPEVIEGGEFKTVVPGPPSKPSVDEEIARMAGVSSVDKVPEEVQAQLRSVAERLIREMPEPEAPKVQTEIKVAERPQPSEEQLAKLEKPRSKSRQEASALLSKASGSIDKLPGDRQEPFQKRLSALRGAVKGTKRTGTKTLRAIRKLDRDAQIAAQKPAQPKTTGLPVDIGPVPSGEYRIDAPQEGAIAAGQLSAAQKLPEKVPGANIKKIINDRLERLGEDDPVYDVKKIVVETADKFPKKIEEARRGKITHEQTQVMADRLGMDQKTLLKRMKGVAFNAEQLVAANQVMTESATRVSNAIKDLGKKDFGEVTDSDIIGLRLEFQRHAAVQAEFAGARAEAGRALSALRIASRDVRQKELEGLMDALGGRELNRRLLQKIVAMDPNNEVGINLLAQKLEKATAFDMFNEYWINAILSGPTTHLANISSNVLTSVYSPAVEKPIASFVDLARAATTGKPREIFLREAPAEVFGMVRALPEGLRTFGKTFATETPADALSKIETMKFRAIPGTTGKIIRIPGRALLAADDFFKTIIKRGKISSLAYRKARQESISKKARGKRVEELIQDPSEKMIKAAQDAADERTFTTPLGPIGNKLMSLRNAIPGARYIVPFMRTPTNIAKFALRRTPVGFFRVKEGAKGKPTLAIRGVGEDVPVEKMGEELAKPIAGSAIMAAAATLALQGIITGSGPKDKKKRYALYRTGWQPYSVKIGDKYFAFSRLEPLGSVLGIAADFVALPSDTKGLDEIAERISYSVGRNITSKTFMQGLANMIDAASDPERYGQRWINQMAGSIVPNIIASGARADDEALRRVDNIRDTYKSRVPGLSKFLLPRRDVWGRQITREGNFWTRFLSPIRYSAAKGDKLDQELVDVGANVGMPREEISLPDRYEKRLGKTGKLTPEEYDQYVVRSGKIARRRVRSLVRTVKYRRAKNEDKVNMINSQFHAARKLVRERMETGVARRILREHLQVAGRSK